MRRVSMFAVAIVAAVTSSAAAGLSILVYDENSNNGYAATAANQKFPGMVTVAGAGNFNALLTGGTVWDLVVMDYPSTHPVGGTDPLVAYVNGGGRALLSTWAGVYTPQLFAAFGAGGGFSISTAGQTLTSAGTPKAAQVFGGVPMPHSTWFDSWASDGVAFTGLAAGAEGLAMLSGVTAGPVMIQANGGRTIASFVIDEWDGPGAVELWRNMMNKVIPAPGAVALLAVAGLAGGRRRRN